MTFDPFRDHGSEKAQDELFQLHCDLLAFLTEKFDLPEIRLMYDPRPEITFGLALHPDTIILPVAPAHETVDWLDLLTPPPDADDPEYLRTGPTAYPVSSNRFHGLRLLAHELAHLATPEDRIHGEIWMAKFVAVLEAAGLTPDRVKRIALFRTVSQDERLTKQLVEIMIKGGMIARGEKPRELESNDAA